MPDKGNGGTLWLGPAWAWDHPVMKLPWCGTILRMGPARYAATPHGTTLQHPGAGTTLGMGHLDVEQLWDHTEHSPNA